MATAQAAIADDAALAALEQAISAHAYTINTAGVPAAMQPLLAHLRHATERAQARDDASTAMLCTNLANYLDMIGDYMGARLLLERALAIREQMLGPQHPDTAASLNSVAELLRSQGDYVAARPLYERALAITEQALGPQHPHTATSLNNLGLLLQSQGDLAGARRYYERALTIREQMLGPQHPDTAMSLNNLGMLLQAQGDLAGARPLLERALAINEVRLGPNHRYTQAACRHLIAIDISLPSAVQPITEIITQTEAAVATALADPSSDRVALTAQLEDGARWAEDGEAAGSPFLTFAAHLRALAAQLITTDAEHIDTP